LCSYFILDNYLVTSITIILMLLPWLKNLPHFHAGEGGWGKKKKKKKNKEASWGSFDARK
jgi:hypothetical protein